MKKIRLKIGGMSCSACSIGLEKYLNKQLGIIDATVHLVLQEATIQYEDNLKIEDIERFIKEAGFECLGEVDDRSLLEKKKVEKKTFLCFMILTIIIFYVSMGHMLGFSIISYLDKNQYPIFYACFLFLFTLPFLYFGRDIFRSGWKNLIHGMPNMDTLVSVSVFTSFIYSTIYFVLFLLGITLNVENLYFDSACMVIFFMKLGRYLDRTSKEKTVEAIGELVQMTPEVAWKKVGGLERKVTVDEVRVDDILIAKPGMKIAVDGVIMKGNTHLDESFITGESIPVKKKEGDVVVAGSMNYDGVIEYQAKRIGKDSMISEIVHLVVDAINTKSPISRFADKVSGYFVPIIFGIAVITLFGYLLLGQSFKEGMDAFVTVLVVACPCALGLATPLSVVVIMGVGAKNGILIKTNEVLEMIPKVDVVVLDKTGTLTYGNLEIDFVVHQETISKEELLTLVASVEKNSTHPIAVSFINYVNELKIPLLDTEDFQNIEGIGVCARVQEKMIYLGNSNLFSKLKIENPYQDKEIEVGESGCSIIYVIRDNQVLGMVGLKDKIKSDAKEVIFKLKEMNKKVIMLTGDNEIVAKRVANELGIEKVFAGVFPDRKKEMIMDLQRNGKKVMMVGDGINDAPSLVVADVGVSVHGAVDIASNSADVIFSKNKLTSILDLFIISKKALGNIKENLFWAFFYNACMIPLAIGVFKPFGIEIHPMFASGAMILSSLTVVGNALRLKNIQLERID